MGIGSGGSGGIVKLDISVGSGWGGSSTEAVDKFVDRVAGKRGNARNSLNFDALPKTQAEC